MKQAGVLVAMMFVLSDTARARQISLEEVLRNYSEEITSITTCGSWSGGRQKGFYRILSAKFLFGGTRLWIQWMADRNSDGRTAVLHTLSPSEINDDHVELLMSDIICDAKDEGLVCRFFAHDGHLDGSYEFELTILQGYGEYRLRKKKAVPGKNSVGPESFHQLGCSPQ